MWAQSVKSRQQIHAEQPTQIATNADRERREISKDHMHTADSEAIATRHINACYVYCKSTAVFDCGCRMAGEWGWVTGEWGGVDRCSTQA